MRKCGCNLSGCYVCGYHIARSRWKRLWWRFRHRGKETVVGKWIDGSYGGSQ